MADILVTGGAGKLGAVVVAQLAARGRHARILSHSGQRRRSRALRW